ncbi:hypothetical protein C8Q74DRAFT_1366795 [Fomes fomentarius]|nr:hypothetical protein C8Q74DRAFT_1366795 [Fomes fomentarius]
MAATGLDGLSKQLAELHISELANVASMALLVYDWQLTLGDEVNMIWMSNARVSKLLYLWIRYFGIAAHAFMLNFLLVANPSEAVSDSFCNAATKVEIAAPTIIWWSVEFVFALRVWILYRRSRKLLIFLAVMYIASISVSFVLLARALPQANPSPIPRGLNIPGCFSEIPDTIYQVLVIGLIATSILCLLTVYRMLTFREEVLHVPRSPLMTLFLRDGLLYYTCVNVIFLLNLFMIRYATPPYKILFTGLMDACVFPRVQTRAIALVANVLIHGHSVPCMLGARVLVNILALVHNDGGPNATVALPYSEPRFARPSRARGSGASVELLDSSVDAGTAAPSDMNDLGLASSRSAGTITTRELR